MENKVLYSVSFKKDFFKTIENVLQVFQNKFGILEATETRTRITGKCYILENNKSYKEKIIYREEPQRYNDFIFLNYVKIIRIKKKEKLSLPN